MESKKGLGYLHNYGNDPKNEMFQADLVIEQTINSIMDTILDPMKRSFLELRIKDHLKSIEANITHEQRLSYDWWIGIHITIDDLNKSIIGYNLEYEEFKMEAVLCLQELEQSSRSGYLSIYERYILILEKMYKIQYILFGIKNNQNEPPDIA